ncbi:MAG: hypothetical protein R3A44_01940 [Caldilineaceae bacterium]
MSQITLVSPDDISIRPLVESALKARARVLELSIRRTQERLRKFEETYGYRTSEFLEKFSHNELQHSFDFDDWIGESRMLTRMQEKLARIQGIQIVD